MNDWDEIADQWEKHAQLSWYESKETFQTRFKWKDRMGKTRDLFKKIRDTKGTFHAKMGIIKDKNGIEWTESENIKKRWQEYTELYKKDLYDPDNHDGVITHLEPDILECEVKWALGSITTNKVELMEFQLTISNPKRWCVKVKGSEVAQSCLTLCDPMDCSLAGSSIHGIFQATYMYVN